MDPRTFLRGEYSAAIFCKIACMDQRVWTNQIQAGNLKVDKRAESSGDKHIMTGYTGIRALIFASLIKTMRYKKASRIAWPLEKENEAAISAMIEKAIDRIGTNEDAICLEVDPTKWVATPVLNRFQALDYHNNSFALAIKINISAHVNSVIEGFRAIQ